MAKWTVVDKDGRSVVVDALYARVEGGGCLVAMGDVNGFHGAVRTWAPGEWRSFGPGGEDAYAIVMRRMRELSAEADALQRDLIAEHSARLGQFEVRLPLFAKYPRGWADVAALRVAAGALGSVAELLRQR